MMNRVRAALLGAVMVVAMGPVPGSAQEAPVGDDRLVDFQAYLMPPTTARRGALSVDNRDLVGVNGLSSEVASALAGTFGAGVAFVNEERDNTLDACVSRIDCFPMKGGIKIYEISNTSGICTSGFIVRLSGSTTRRVLTAGHCLEKAATGLPAGWSHSGTQFGTGQTETWGQLSDADAGLISVGTISGADNLFMGSGPSDIRSANGSLHHSAQNVGDDVCRSGKASGYLCGEVTLEDRVRDVDGKDIEHQWVVDFDAIAGDSGGPYFMGSVAWGIHSDSTSANPPGGSAWYSPMSWVFSKLSDYGVPIVLCTNADCTSAQP